jgi:glyoxylase-like metal-dependent hydrolase (beta-lactamase superfamily II)
MTYQVDNIYAKRFFYFNLYVIKGDDGDILIDTGFVGMKKKLKRWLDNFNIKLIILTHAHVDHIWNVQYLKKLYNCEVMIGINDIENIDNSKINSKASDKKHIRWTKLMNFGMKKFVPKSFEIDMGLCDNQLLSKYGIDMKIVGLSGHTKGSIGILYNDYLFAGDALVNRKKRPQIAYQNQDNTSAKDSYNKIIELKPKLIFVGHDKKINYDNLIKNL